MKIISYEANDETVIVKITRDEAEHIQAILRRLPDGVRLKNPTVYQLNNVQKALTEIQPYPGKKYGTVQTGVTTAKNMLLMEAMNAKISLTPMAWDALIRE